MTGWPLAFCGRGVWSAPIRAPATCHPQRSTTSGTAAAYHAAAAATSRNGASHQHDAATSEVARRQATPAAAPVVAPAMDKASCLRALEGLAASAGGWGVGGAGGVGAGSRGRHSSHTAGAVATGHEMSQPQHQSPSQSLPAVGCLEPRELQDLVWALGKVVGSVAGSGGAAGALHALAAALAARLAEPGLLGGMAPVGLSMVVYGMGKMGLPYSDTARLVGAVAAGLAAGGEGAAAPAFVADLQLLPAATGISSIPAADMPPPQLARFAWALARLSLSADGRGGSAAVAGAGMACLRLFNGSRGALLAALPHLGPQGVAMLAWAYATAQLNPGDGALAALWERAAVLAPGLSGRGLAMVGAAMAHFRCRHARLTRALLATAAARIAFLQLVCSRVPHLLPPPAKDRRGQQPPAQVQAQAQQRRVAPGRLRRHLAAAEAVPLLWGLAAMARGPPPSPAPAAAPPAAPGMPPGHAEALPPRQAASGPHAGSGAGHHTGGAVLPPDVVAGLAAVVEAAIRADAGCATTSADTNRSGDKPERQRQPQRQRQLDGGLLSMFLSACVEHRHRPAPPVLQAACALLLPLAPGLASHTLCELAWAVTMLAPPVRPGTGFSGVSGSGAADLGAHAMLPLGPRTRPSDATVPVEGAASAADGVDNHEADQAPAWAGELALLGDAGQLQSQLQSLQQQEQPEQQATGREASGQGDELWAAVARLLRRATRGVKRTPIAAAAAAEATAGAGVAVLTPEDVARLGAVEAGGARTGGSVAMGGVRRGVRVRLWPLRLPPGERLFRLRPRAELLQRATAGLEAAGGQELLRRCLALLSRRLCVERTEVLTLESLVRAAWAMCVARMYTPRLFRYAAARLLGLRSTAPLEGRPALLRALVEVRALVARQRPSTWRRLRLSRRWRKGQEAGARWRLAPAEVLAAQPAGMVRQLLRAQASLEAAAEARELPVMWRGSFAGDRHAVMQLGRRAAFAIVLVAPWHEVAAATTASGPRDAAAASPGGRAGAARGATARAAARGEVHHTGVRVPLPREVLPWKLSCRASRPVWGQNEFKGGRQTCDVMTMADAQSATCAASSASEHNGSKPTHAERSK
eukprot:XP_001700138.1 predicted protein [Chlamydomonas reinhardtii]